MSKYTEQENKIYKMLKDIRAGNVRDYLGGDDEHIEVKYICNIKLPTGRIVANDPCCMFEIAAFSKTAPKGEFPVYLYIYHTNSDSRVALAEIRFSERIPEKYEFTLIERFEKIKFRNICYMGYGVDSGMGGFMDKTLADSINGYSTEKIEKMQQEQFELSEKSYVPTYSTFDYTPDGENSNMVGFSSGWGDGCYESYWGYDENGEICSLTTYFDVLNTEIEWGEGVNFMKNVIDAAYQHSVKITKKKLGVDIAAASNHLAVFLRWMYEHKLLSEYLIEEYPELPAIIEEKEIDLRDVIRLAPVFSSRLSLQHFNNIGQDFARSFYVFGIDNGYPACVDRYAEEYFGTEKYNSEEFQDEAYLFTPYDENYYKRLAEYLDEAFDKYMSSYVTSSLFKYDEKAGKLAAEIHEVRFECEKIDYNIEMKAYEYANFYRKRLKNLVTQMMDELAAFYGEMSAEEVIESLGKPLIDLDNRIITYTEHTLDDVHIIDVEFEGILEKVLEVRIDG